MAGHRALSAPFRQRGFSLVEVLFVAALTVILAALAVPALRDRDDVSGDVRRLVSDGARVRSWARTTWRTASLDIDAANRRWRLIDDENVVIESANSDAGGWRTLGPTVDFQTVAGTTPDFTFTPDGRGTEAAAVLLVGNQATWQVSMDALSGSITATEL